jgi:hypothetical protein
LAKQGGFGVAERREVTPTGYGGHGGAGHIFGATVTRSDRPLVGSTTSKREATVDVDDYEGQRRAGRAALSRLQRRLACGRVTAGRHLDPRWTVRHREGATATAIGACSACVAVVW